MYNQLKKQIVKLHTELKVNFNQHNAKLMNAKASQLFEMTGEVYVMGEFVKHN